MPCPRRSRRRTLAELRSIFDVGREELRQLLADWGEPGYRADQVFTGLYGHLVTQPDELTTLPRELRLRLADAFSFHQLELTAQQQSADGETEKSLLTSHDGQSIEAVLMRYRDRRTACISTQAGCGMGCVFCATGQMGFQRNLTSGEIIEQVLILARKLKHKDDHFNQCGCNGHG